MAHYLSDVTHLRLELRWNEAEGEHKDAIHTHDFTGQIRCAEVVPHKAPEVEIWTGDTDGSLTIRRGLDGRPVRVVPALGYNVFVYCLQYAKPNMWAGRSDGFIQVYDATGGSFGSICEFKAHGGTVFCMCAIGAFVVSGGSDWQIVVWNAATALRVHQFTGHANGVRCFAKEGLLLYSGADDGVIHCWDMQSLTEKRPLWPIAAHEESVRGLVRHEVYLFSCSNDGSIKAWNTQTAQLAKIIDQRPAAVNSLMLIPSAGKLWGCSSDGLVTVWDVGTLEQCSSITSHRATNVPVVRQVASANSAKLWTVSGDGMIRVWYNDTEPSAQNAEFAAIAEMEQTLQTHVDACRQRIVHNYHQLERCKEDLLELERRDLTKKKAMAETFSLISTRSRLMRSVHGIDLAAQQAQRRSLMKDVSSVLATYSRDAFLRPFYLCWRLLAERARTKARKTALKDCVTQVSQNALTANLLHKVAAHARQQFGENQRRVIATNVAKKNNGVLLRRFLANWGAAVTCSKLYAQQVALQSCPRTTASFIRSCNGWNRLRIAQVHVEGHQLLVATALRQEETSANRRLLRDRFDVWQRFLRRKAQRKLLRSCAAVLEAENSRRALATFFLRWATTRQRRCLNEAKVIASQQAGRIQQLTCAIEKGTGVSEEDLEVQLREKQSELARILEECRDADREVEARHHEKRALQRELLRDYSVDHSLPIEQQLDKSIFFLKARGVNTYHDIQKLAAAREELRKMRPDAMIGDGIARIRKVLGRYTKPDKIKVKGEPDWYVGEAFNKIKRKGVDRAADGICRLVVAFDSADKKLVSSWISTDDNTKWDAKHQYAAEVTANLGPLLELALRAYRYHRGEDPMTGLPRRVLKKKVRKTYEAPQSAGASKGPTKHKTTKRRLVRRKRVAAAAVAVTPGITASTLVEEQQNSSSSPNPPTIRFVGGGGEAGEAPWLRVAASVDPDQEGRSTTQRSVPADGGGGGGDASNVHEPKAEGVYEKRVVPIKGRRRDVQDDWVDEDDSASHHHVEQEQELPTMKNDATTEEVDPAAESGAVERREVPARTAYLLEEF